MVGIALLVCRANKTRQVRQRRYYKEHESFISGADINCCLVAPLDRCRNDCVFCMYGIGWCVALRGQGVIETCTIEFRSQLLATIEIRSAIVLALQCRLLSDIASLRHAAGLKAKCVVTATISSNQSFSSFSLSNIVSFGNMKLTLKCISETVMFTVRID